MNHNKLNIIPGDTMILDKTFRNSSKIKVVHITTNGMFSRVHPSELTNPTDDDCWDTMTNRLSLIE